MTEKQFSKGDVIFREGDNGECMYQIIDGVVGIYTLYDEPDRNLLTELKKDQFFGEMALIEAYPRSATAVAVEDVKLLEISSGEVSEYLKKDPGKIMEIMKSLGGRLKELTKDYSEVNAAIEELRQTEEKPKSAGLIARIKKFSEVYKKNKIADQLSAEIIRKMEQAGHADGYTVNVNSYRKNTLIFKEGETGDCMYDIHYGSVGIYKAYGTSEEKLLTTLVANQFFGELGMIDEDQRSATAVALEDDTTLEAIYPSDLNALFEKNPAKVQMILAHLSNRLRKLTQDYMKACELLYQVSAAEDSGNALSDQVKGAINNYTGNPYD